MAMKHRPSKHPRHEVGCHQRFLKGLNNNRGMDLKDLAPTPKHGVPTIANMGCAPNRSFIGRVLPHGSCRKHGVHTRRR